MKKILKLFIMTFLLFTTISCDDLFNSNIESSSSNNSEIEDSSMDSSTIDESNSINTSSSTSEEKVYQKDEEGFYVLEDDYFKNDAIKDEKRISKLKYSDDIPSEYVYSQMRLFAADKQIPLINCKTNMSQVWNGLAPSRMNNAVAIVALEGKMTFKLQCNFAILDECIIRPLAANITPKIDEDRRVIEFEISSAGQYTIELRSKRTLHFFVNDYYEFEEYKDDSNLIYFGPGVHNKNNNKYINSYNKIDVPSNCTVFVDYGAIVQGALFAHNKSNIKVVGGGIIDGSVFTRDANNNIQTIPYEFNYCTNLLFKGIVTTDPAGWCYNLYFCNEVELDNIKIISSRSNGDGVSVQSCQNVECKNSFVRSWDDSLVVKNYPHWSNRNNQGTTKNVSFENCILWTDLAQSMEIGFETVGKVMEDITFNNITILHNYHKAPISIHNGNNANLKRVKFTNITIEDAAMGGGDGNKYLIDISCAYSSTWSDKQATTELGSVDDVLISNVLVHKIIDNYVVSIVGSVDPRVQYGNSTHYVSNVKVEDIMINDNLFTKDYENYQTKYSKNVTIENTGKEVTGANIPYTNSSEYGSNYQIEVI